MYNNASRYDEHGCMKNAWKEQKVWKKFFLPGRRLWTAPQHQTPKFLILKCHRFCWRFGLCSYHVLWSIESRTWSVYRGMRVFDFATVFNFATSSVNNILEWIMISFISVFLMHIVKVPKLIISMNKNAS